MGNEVMREDKYVTIVPSSSQHQLAPATLRYLGAGGDFRYLDTIQMTLWGHQVDRYYLTITHDDVFIT